MRMSYFGVEICVELCIKFPIILIYFILRLKEDEWQEIYVFQVISEIESKTSWLDRCFAEA